MNRMRARTAAHATLLWLATLSLAACSGGVSSTNTTAAATSSQFTVGGSVTGLSGSNLVLQNNGGDNLPVSGNGTFTFPTTLIPGDSYSVSVLSEPSTPSQTCAVTNGSGTMGSGNITGIALVCADKTTTTDTIGGTAVGVLGAGLVLQDNNGDNLVVSANGPFTFATPLASGVPYAVSVLSPPVSPYQDCVIANGVGTTGNVNVTNVAVSCKTNLNPAYTIGGNVSGVSGAGAVVLQNNGRDNVTVSADGPFQFALPIPSGSTYDVTSLRVSGQQSQTCTFTNASGTVAASNITNVSVACQANALVSVTVSGLSGSGLVLQDNGGDNLAVTNNGTATFATAVASNTTYRVTVLTQPSNPIQNCVVGSGVGTAVAGKTAAVTVVCTTIGYTVGGTVSGLSGTGLVLQDNGVDNLAVTATGPSVPFTFPTPIQIGAPYSVSVLTQPATPYQTCTVKGGTGTIAAANVTSVAIACTTNSYSVSGTVSGLPTDPTTGLAVTGLALRDNGGAAYAITANGAFTLPGTVASGASYSVTISGEPTGLACSVASGTGTIANAAVSNVAVSCSRTGGYLYVTNGGGNNLSGFAIDYNSGALQPLTQVVAPAGQPNAIVATTDAHPSSIVRGCTLSYSSTGNDYPVGLYVANSASGTVGAYSVNTNTSTALGGTLTLITSPSILAGTRPGYLDHLNPDLCVAYALNSGSSNVSAYSANPTTGALAALTGSPVATPATGSAPTAAAHATRVGANLKAFEYVASQVSNDLTAYAVATDGTLSLVTNPLGLPGGNPVAAGTNPSAVATYISPAAPNVFSAPYVYVANQGSNNISVYQGDANSGLLAALGSPIAAGNGPTALVVVPPNLLYVANGLDNTVSAYSISTAAPNTGLLTPLGSSVATGANPVALTFAFINISSAYLYVVDSQSNDVYAYLITTTAGPAYGSLTFVGKYAVGTAPTSVAVPYNVFGG
jgi:6-phosphogluconolactonase (cycloisomerase 2 family)